MQRPSELKMNRRKKFLSIEEQVSLIQRRGLILPSEKSAENFLERQNYYRFSGYMRYFQENLAGDEARFFPGTQWDEVKSWVVVYLFSNLGLVSWRWFRGHLGDKG